MRDICRTVAASLLACCLTGSVTPGAGAGRDGQENRAGTTLALHPDNSHYFQWRGRPTILITSAEHYGAVLNLDFDYRRYLDTLAGDGLNYTRVFTGAYVEPDGASVWGASAKRTPVRITIRSIPEGAA